MSTKYIVVKIFLTIFLLTPGVSMFSQINHEDSIGYVQFLKANILMGNDIRGKTIPGFKAKGKNGTLLTEDDLRSRITFINFWFETCAPCVAEFQALEKFYNNNRARENFQFVSITFEADSTIERVRKKNDLTYPVYHLSSDSCRKLILKLGYPANLIINKNLEIVYSIAGGSTNPKEADKYLNHFIQGELDKQFK